MTTLEQWFLIVHVAVVDYHFSSQYVASVHFQLSTTFPADFDFRWILE